MCILADFDNHISLISFDQKQQKTNLVVNDKYTNNHLLVDCFIYMDHNICLDVGKVIWFTWYVNVL